MVRTSQSPELSAKWLSFTLRYSAPELVVVIVVDVPISNGYKVAQFGVSPSFGFESQSGGMVLGEVGALGLLCCQNLFPLNAWDVSFAGLRRSRDVSRAPFSNLIRNFHPISFCSPNIPENL